MQLARLSYPGLGSARSEAARTRTTIRTRVLPRIRTARGSLKQPAPGAACHSSSVESEERRLALRGLSRSAAQPGPVTLMDRSQTHRTGLQLQQHLRLPRSQLAHRLHTEGPALDLPFVGPFHQHRTDLAHHRRLIGGRQTQAQRWSRSTPRYDSSRDRRRLIYLPVVDASLSPF